jgi:hypothetical protein
MSTWYWLGSKGRRDPSEDFPPPAFSDSRGIVLRQTGSWQEKALCETVVASSERMVGKPEVTLRTGRSELGVLVLEKNGDSGNYLKS